MASYTPVEATLRGLAVLEAVSRLGSCSVNDIHAETRINRPTVVRMLETLIHAGYVRRQPSARYALTAKSLGLSAGYRPGAEIARHAPSVLAALQRNIRWPSDVAICDGADMVTVATSPPSSRLYLNQPAGYRANILSTSLGRAYIAFAPEAERTRLLRMLASSPDQWNDLARDPAGAARVFANIRRRGYATIDRRAAQTYSNGALQTLGVPILLNGVAIASMNAIFLREAVDIRGAIKKFLPALQRAATQFSILIQEGISGAPPEEQSV